MSQLPAPGAPLLPGSSTSTLGDIQLQKGEKLYIQMTYDSCACGKIHAEMFVGDRQSHDRLIAKADLPFGICNQCARVCGILACFAPEPIPVTSGDGGQIGTMTLGRAWSRFCCWPYMKVALGTDEVGTVQTKCCLVNTCVKDVVVNQKPEYSSKKCILNKLLCCFIPPCWNFYRALLKNRTMIEYYTVTGDETKDAFEVWSDVDAFNCIGCGCLKHFEIVVQGAEHVGTVKPSTYMMAFASGILEGVRWFT